MQNITISATELKKNASAILNDVAYGGKIAIIERHGKPLVKIISIEEAEKKTRDIKVLLDKYYGAAPDFPNVTKMRHFRKRNVRL